MLIKIARLIMVLVFMVVSFTGSPSYARVEKAPSISIGFIGNNKIAHVTVNDKNVITIKADKNVNPLEKTRQIAQNLNKLLYNKQLRPDRILPAIRGNNYIARVDKSVIFTVDKALAGSVKSNPSSVTLSWVNKLRNALGGKSLGYRVASRSLSSATGRNSQFGYASWYGNAFQGRPTSSGEAYDMNKYTAAHRTLPLGTPILVTNMGTGRSVLVRVNDRGPFADTGHRVIDLSSSAFKAISSLNAGVIRIKIDVMN